jgi:hypothetical protein
MSSENEPRLSLWLVLATYLLTFLVESNRDGPTSLARGKGYPMGLRSVAGSELGSRGGFASYKAFRYPRRARRRRCLCRSLPTVFILPVVVFAAAVVIPHVFVVVPAVVIPVVVIPVVVFAAAAAVVVVFIVVRVAVAEPVVGAVWV